jgi:hypothetical protein
MSLRALFLGALLAGTATFTAIGEAEASREIGLGVSYDPRLPLGGFRSFVPNPALAGVQARWDFFPLDALSTGVEVQYHLFQRGLTTDTVPITDGAITATTFRYASFWSVVPTVRYYFSARGDVRPYAGIGAGLTSMTSTVLMSDLSERDIASAFIVQPSLGVLWRLSSDSTAAVASVAEETYSVRRPLESMFGVTASLSYAFTTADVTGASNVQYAGVQIGVYAKP